MKSVKLGIVFPCNVRVIGKEKRRALGIRGACQLAHAALVRNEDVAIACKHALAAIGIVVAAVPGNFRECGQLQLLDRAAIRVNHEVLQIIFIGNFP